MKKFFLLAMFSLAAWMGARAMSFERAQAEALYLTDKMAYELNLNEQQYNDAYEINLDYFLRVDSPSDIYGSYYSYRLNDFRCILHDWQYSLLAAADYFLSPVVWRAGGWYFPIYGHYHRGYFYFGRPMAWATYHGGHSRHHYADGFYRDRRPHWNGGLRGGNMNRPSAGMHHSPSGPSRPASGRDGGRGGNRGNVGSGSGSHGAGGSRGGAGLGSSDSRGSRRGAGVFDGSSSRMSGGSGSSVRSGGSSSSRGMNGASGGSVSGGTRGSSRGGGISGGHGGSSGSGRISGGSRRGGR